MIQSQTLSDIYVPFFKQEGDCIGLMRKSSGALHYYVNGLDQGVAAARTHQTVWGVVDLYGMAVKVTIIDHTTDDCRDVNRRDGAWAVGTSENRARLSLAPAISEEEGTIRDIWDCHRGCYYEVLFLLDEEIV